MVTARSKLDARLDSELPAPLAVGAGTALFLEGRCSHPEREIKKLEIVVGSDPFAVSAWKMPRPGTVSEGDWWWAFIPVEQIDEPITAEVSIRAHFGAGEFEEASLGRLNLVASALIPASPKSGGEGPLIAIAMATYNPPPELFRQQIESIRAQTHDNWVCVISDDASDPEAFVALKEIVGDDERFSISQSAGNGGFYRNFGRALSMCPPDAAFVAMCDQDDRWYPEKLERLLESLEPGSHLVYSDARLVDEQGKVLSDTYWRERRNNYTNFTSLLLANTITGAASLFSAELLPHVLPFPPPQGNIYHDHWVASVAMALGPVSYVDEPLYEYVQHSSAVVGHARANSGVRRPGTSVTNPRNWRSLYFGANCRVALVSRVLDARCGELMEPRKRRIVRRMTAIADARRLMPWLALRANRRRFGWNETAGREQALAKGLTWRHATRVRIRTAGVRAKLGLTRGSVAELPPPGRAAKPFEASPRGDEPWLTPLLVDYFGRDASTLTMRLLGTSPEVVIEDQYPFERKYFAYLWRWSRLVERTEWPRDEWKLSQLASLHQEEGSMMLGPPPWLPRDLFDSEESGSFAHSVFRAAWSEFSRRAVRASGSDPRVVPRYYAEKHVNTWKVDLGVLPEAKLIVLLRDPRDTFVSIKNFAEQRGADFGRDRVDSAEEYLEHVLARQQQRMRWIEELLEEGRVPVVRYEDLMNDLDGTAAKLEKALSIELNPQAALSDRELRKRHATTATPESSIGRWRVELTEEEIEVFDRMLGDEMRTLGFAEP